MRRYLMLWALILAVVPLAAGEDPTMVDPDHYQVVFENEEVRVLRITYGPGEESVLHYHPDGVAVFLTDHHVQFTLPDGTTAEVDSAAGEATWAAGGDHLPKNLGEEPLEVILVEMKGDEPDEAEEPDDE